MTSFDDATGEYKKNIMQIGLKVLIIHTEF